MPSRLVGSAVMVCALFGLISSTVYLVLVVAATWRFRVRARQVRGAPVDHRVLPRVSILKPLHGLDFQLEECLESFFTQDYPDFEMVFGARSNDDGAWPIVERLSAKYPQIQTRSIISGEPHYPNAKVSSLERMVAAATSAYLVIADSDARVESCCLREVVPPLLEPRVGLVTCLYRGAPAGGLCSRLEALGMSVEMTAGVLVADMLEGMRFGLGPTMATRKDALAAIGGVGALGDYCADDYVLGQRTHAAGRTVVLSHHVIEHVAVNRSVRASLQHHLRWMRSTRFSRPLGHLGAGLTFAMPFGILALVAGLADSRAGLAFVLFGWALVNRIVQCIVVGWGAVRDSNALASCWLYPVRDLLGFVLWCGSFFGTGILWRGERYDLEQGGRMKSAIR